MSEADESAFPSYEFEVLENVGIKVYSGGGLTKREEFAKAAMQGFISHGWTSVTDFGEVAMRAVAYADALLAELAKGKE